MSKKKSIKRKDKQIPQKSSIIPTLSIDKKILDEYKSSNDKELEKISLKDFRLFIGPYMLSKVIGTGARSKVAQESFFLNP